MHLVFDTNTYDVYFTYLSKLYTTAQTSEVNGNDMSGYLYGFDDWSGVDQVEGAK